MARGELVSDALVLAIVRSRLEQRRLPVGWLPPQPGSRPKPSRPCCNELGQQIQLVG
jgi:hypothetical protein